MLNEPKRFARTQSEAQDAGVEMKSDQKPHIIATVA